MKLDTETRSRSSAPK